MADRIADPGCVIAEPNIPSAGQAPGGPGIEARWTSSAKSGVGTALGPGGRLWFTVSHGILNEIYYPRVDQACTRDMGLLVTDRGEKEILADPVREVVLRLGGV